VVELDFDMCDFPIAYQNKDCIYNWFDFNDSTVTPILPGKLQSQFGGSSENAYILMYRRKMPADIKIPIPEVPSYWKDAMQVMNASAVADRLKYEYMKD